MASSIVEFKNEALNVTINTIKVGDTIYFKGKDVAKVLEYSDPDQAIRKHVEADYKCLLSDLDRGVAPPVNLTGGFQIDGGSDFQRKTSNLYRRTWDVSTHIQVQKGGSQAIRNVGC